MINRYKMFWKYSSQSPQLAAGKCIPRGRLPRLVKAASASRATLRNEKEARCFIFTPSSAGLMVCWFDGLSAGLNKNY